MSDMLGYKDKIVVITGAASGMGHAAAQRLIEAGAKLYAIDIAPVDLPVESQFKVDLREQDQVDAALAEIPGEIDFLFNCAGVPHPPFSHEDTIVINILAMRYLTEALLPRMRKGGGVVSIASAAGLAWAKNLPLIDSFLATEGYEQGRKWIADNPELGYDAYSFAKQVMIVYTMRRAGELAKREIRINCIAPSPTQTKFMDQLTETVPTEWIDPAVPSVGRWAEPVDMGDAIVLINSKLGRFVSGVCLPVDYGHTAETIMGQRPDYAKIL